MSESESWEKYGFPDPTLRTGYLPYCGLVKAFAERVAASGGSGSYDLPEYFYPTNNSRELFAVFERGMSGRCGYFVNPDKIPDADNYDQCFWNYEDLTLAAAGGIQEDVFSAYYNVNRLAPDFPVKWARQRYNAINLLRYIPTSSALDWPTFTYEDCNDTFNFKAPET